MSGFLNKDQMKKCDDFEYMVWGQIQKSKLFFGRWRGSMLRDGAIALPWKCKALSLDAHNPWEKPGTMVPSLGEGGRMGRQVDSQGSRERQATWIHKNLSSQHKVELNAGRQLKLTPVLQMHMSVHKCKLHEHVQTNQPTAWCKWHQTCKCGEYVLPVMGVDRLINSFDC